MSTQSPLPSSPASSINPPPLGPAAGADATTAPRRRPPLLASWDALRRDVGMVLQGLRGQTPPPFTPRSPRRLDAQRSSLGLLKPRALVVRDVVRETADAVTLVLADPHGAPLPFAAGQFFTLVVSPTAGGGWSGPLRRAYSASSCPLNPDGTPAQTVSITSKRVPGGRMSTYLNEGVRPGDLLQVLGPSGQFTPQPSPDRRRHLILLAGGSGITPMMSIIRTVLQVEPQSRITLLYGNRGEADIVFYRALQGLAAAHTDRLNVRFVLAHPPPGWRGGQGQLDADTTRRELDALVPASRGAADSLPIEYYLCGPEGMMTAARSVLTAAGVPADQIREERFASLRDPAADAGERSSSEPQPMQLQIVHAGAAPVTQRLTIQPGQTLLEAGLSAGVAMPFSCAMGGCGACKAKLDEGEVIMAEPNCLSSSERAAGEVLCCIAQPRTPVRVTIQG